MFEKNPWKSLSTQEKIEFHKYLLNLLASAASINFCLRYWKYFISFLEKILCNKSFFELLREIFKKLKLREGKSEYLHWKLIRKKLLITKLFWNSQLTFGLDTLNKTFVLGIKFSPSFSPFSLYFTSIINLFPDLNNRKLLLWKTWIKNRWR